MSSFSTGLFSFTYTIYDLSRVSNISLMGLNRAIYSHNTAIQTILVQTQLHPVQPIRIKDSPANGRRPGVAGEIRVLRAGLNPDGRRNVWSGVAFHPAQPFKYWPGAMTHIRNPARERERVKGCVVAQSLGPPQHSAGPPSIHTFHTKPAASVWTSICQVFGGS